MPAMAMANGRQLRNLVEMSLWLGLLGAACNRQDPTTEQASPSCETGTLRCPCYRNSTCDDGLTCLSEVCVVVPPGSTGGAASTSAPTTIDKGVGGGQSSTSVTLPVASGGAASTGAPLSGAAGVSALTPGGSSGVSATVPNSGQSGAAGARTAPTTGGSVGATTSTPSGGVSGSGSRPASNTGGVPGTGGAAAISCTALTNLIADASNNLLAWYGGNPALTEDNTCGAQGYVRAFSDVGIDKVPGGSDDSVRTPALDDSTPAPGDFRSPCSGGKCCIRGETHSWPKRDGSTDYTASVWGGGIRISLNEFGDSGQQNPYVGGVKGFKVRTSGTLNGQAIRLGYAQAVPDPAQVVGAACSPFVQKTNVGEYEVPFVGGIACPTWSCSPSCIAPTAHPYALEVQVVGGDIAGSFELCIDGVTPML